MWVFASETSAERVDASEVYCPISIRHMQDRGYVVHFDGSRWRELDWPAPGEPLAEVVTNGDGSIDVVTGSAADEATFRGSMPAPQRTFRFVNEQAPRLVASPEAARAERFGWHVDGRVLSLVDGRAWTLPDERITRLVVRDASEAFVQTANAGSESASPWTTWYRVR